MNDICGNPPYAGHARQSEQQKLDVRDIFAEHTTSWKSLDYVSGWFAKAAWYSTQTNTSCAFVATNSICQGEQVPILWPIIRAAGQAIRFAQPSANTALIDGVRKFAMDVRELDIDLIDRINPFGEAYAILAKTMSEDSLKQVAAAIAAKRTSLTPEEAKGLAVRASQFKNERGRLPSLDAQDPW